MCFWDDDIKVVQPSLDEVPSTGGCCQITDVSNIKYQGTPGVSRYLHFDLECDDSWPVSGDGCFNGETFIGENQDIRWAEVVCCLDSSSDDLLHCESERSVEQKKSWTKVKLDGYPGDCKWESPKFYSPTYTEQGPEPDRIQEQQLPHIQYLHLNYLINFQSLKSCH